MNLNNYEYQSEFVKKFVETGREEGRAEHAVRAVLSVLAARGVPVTDNIRQRVESCRDVALLDLWHTRAVTAHAAADVIAEQQRVAAETSASPELPKSKMNLRNYEYQSELVKKFVQVGREQGRAEHAVRAVLRVLAARGVAVTDDVRQRIEACRDIEVLDRWHTRASTAVTAVAAADVVAE